MTASRSRWMFTRAIEDLVNLCTKRKKGLDFRSRDTIPPPPPPLPSSFQNSRRRLFWDLKCAGVAPWHIGQSVSSDFSLYSLFIYLFSKLMTHTYIFIFQKRFSRSRTYSHLLFKKECSVKGSLFIAPFFLFIILDIKSPICSIVIVGWEVCIQ